MKPRGWSLRKRTGDVYPLPDSATLQRWVVEGRVSRDDEVSRDGEAWTKAGTLPDLEPFFAVVDQARRTRAPGRTTEPPPEPPRSAPERKEPVGPRPDPGHGPTVGGPVAESRTDSWEVPERAPVHADEPAWANTQVRAPVEQPRRPGAARRPVAERRTRWPWVLVVFLLLVVAGAASGAAMFFFRPEWIPADILSVVRGWTGRADGPAAPVAATPAPAEPQRPAEPPPSRPPPPAPAPAPTAAPAPAPTPSPAAPSAPPAASAPSPPPSATSPAGSAPASPAPAASPPAPSSEPPAVAAPVPPVRPPASDAPPPPRPPPAGSEGDASASGTSGDAASAPGAQARPAPTEPSPRGGEVAGTPGARPGPAPKQKQDRPAVALAPGKSATERERPPAASGRVRDLVQQARRLRDRGRADAALDLYGRALQVDQNSADALAGRGLCYLDLSRYSQAEESFRSALAVDASNPVALMGLAETYRYEGNRADAVSYYRKYLAAHPKGEDAGAARNAIKALEE